MPTEDVPPPDPEADLVSRMSAGIGLQSRSPHQSTSSSSSSIAAAQSSHPQEHLHQDAPLARSAEEEEEDAELQAILEQSRASAEAEEARRREQEEQDLQRVLQMSQASEHQHLSEAERLAQEERDLMQALQESTQTQHPYSEVELEQVLKQSLNQHGPDHPFPQPLASGSGLRPDQKEAYTHSDTSTSSASSAQRTPLALTTIDLPQRSPDPSHNLSSASSRSSVISISRRHSSRPLPLPPNAHRRSLSSASSPSPPTSTLSRQSTSQPLAHHQQSPGSAPRLLNPFEDLEAPAGPSHASHPVADAIPYLRPSGSLEHVPARSSSLELIRKQSFASLGDYRSFSDSMSTLELGSMHSYAVSSNLDIREDDDEIEDIQEDEQVSAVKIGFPRMGPLLNGRMFPQVVQISHSEPGLETFAIEAQSYRSLITYLYWNADSMLISDYPSGTPSKASVAFEFFEGAHAPSLRLCLTLDSLDPGSKPAPPAPTHHPEDRVIFRSEVPAYHTLPITAYELAKDLQTIQKSAKLCCDNGGGALYDLGQEIEKLARVHGEKGQGSDEPDPQEASNRFDRIKRRLARKKEGKHNSISSHAELVTSSNPLSPKSGKPHKKFARLRGAHASGSSSSPRNGTSGRGESEGRPRELGDEAFFITPFLLPRTVSPPSSQQQLQSPNPQQDSPPS